MEGNVFDEQRIIQLEQQVDFLLRHLGIDPAAAAAAQLPPFFYEALRTRHKIEAIRIYRQVYGAGLAEAKRAVEQIAGEQGW